MMIEKLGQFLLTYGWCLVIFVAIIGAVLYFRTIDPALYTHVRNASDTHGFTPAWMNWT